MTAIEEGRAAEQTDGQPPPSNSPDETTSSKPASDAAGAAAPSAEGENASRRKILIGSQRDPAAYRARPKRDWVPVEGEGAQGTMAEKGPHGHRHRHRGGRGRGREHGAANTEHGAANTEHGAASTEQRPASTEQAVPAPVAAESAVADDGRTGFNRSGAEPPHGGTTSAQAPQGGTTSPGSDSRRAVELPPLEPLPEVIIHPASEDDTPVIPGKRQRLTASMEAELDRAMAGVSLDELMSGDQAAPQEGTLEPESRHRVKIAAIRRDDVFVEFGGREQGCVPVHSFQTPPNVGDEIEVVVQRYHPEEGLYDLGLPGAAVELGNWDEVQEGMLVEAQVTGHNTGGLECEVNHLRGFIPVSQISLYRVEDLAQFVGQRFACLITDANRERRNLVLSRRAVLEREKEEQKQKFFASLAPGQIHEGTVRKLMDFGAFVELGNGVDGLLHVSQLSWSRVKHPSEVVQEGQPIRVRIEKIDPQTGRIGLSYRDLQENPWAAAVAKFPPRSQVRGKVTRLMDFGAFVELEPGIEGLVHISELSHKRVWRPADVVKEGDDVEVLVLNVDPQAQRMSLSIKALHQPEPTKKDKEEPAEHALPPPPKKSSRPSNMPLKGGLGRSGGEQFGLKW